MKNRTCQICSGAVIPLGKLGIRTHGRCQNCGMMWSWVLRSDKTARWRSGVRAFTGTSRIIKKYARNENIGCGTCGNDYI